MTSRIRIIDSHTGGEPTRVIVAGGPTSARGTMAERLRTLPRASSTISAPPW